MEEKRVKINRKVRRYGVYALLVSAALFIAFLFSLPDGTLHIVFCDVGQGDAAYIRFPSRHDMLIDGGANNRVLSCLGKHMPFYDRTIDIVLLTHPQKDHYQGLTAVFERFSVRHFIPPQVSSDGEGYQTLLKLVEKKKVPVRLLLRGDSMGFDAVGLHALWPERGWLVSHTRHLSSDNRILGLTTTDDLNDFSSYLLLRYGDFSLLFTGDGDRRIQPEILQLGNLPDVDVLKFPHHGSKSGILSEFLDRLNPELAVISIGKNSYGHPAGETLDMLERMKVAVRRTDTDGDIEVVSDGDRWWVR